MDIKEAAKKAHELGTGFYNTDCPDVTIIPTNTSACCIPYVTYGEQKIHTRWQPTLNDLISDKWNVWGLNELSQEVSD